MEIKFIRIKHLISRYFAENTGTMVKVVSAICLILFVIACLTHIGARNMNYTAMVILVYVAWFCGGFWFSSSIFREMHNPGSGYRFLTLPATNEEKLVYAWLLTSPLVIVIAIIAMYVVAFLTASFCTVFLNIRYSGLNIFEYGFGHMVLLYLVLQPVFLLGATLFRKIQFFNTILWIGIIGIATQILTWIFTFFIFFPVREYSFDSNFFRIIWNTDYFTGIFWPGIKILFWYVMAPFFILLTYFRLKETEIR